MVRLNFFYNPLPAARKLHQPLLALYGEVDRSVIPEVNITRGQLSVQEINDGFIRQITKEIAGHEQEPAEKVFKNVQIMKG